MLDNLSRVRLSRRRALAAAGGVGASALALSLVGCGGSSGDAKPGASNDKSGLLTAPEDTSKQAKSGGTLPWFVSSEPISLDPLTTSVGSIPQALWAYSRLLRFKPSTPGNNSKGELEGDTAESWEISQDGLQVTFKLRNNVKFDPRPPTNGRAMEANDVKWSWDRFAASSGSAGEVSNKKNPASPVDSFSTPDNRTVVVKLAFPYAPILKMLSDHRYLVVIQPTEADGKFDARVEMRGSGPWMLSKWQPSVGFEWTKNPNWHIAGRPFLDGISQPLVREYAQRLAQLKTGGLWTALDTNGLGVRAEDVIPTKKDQPKLVMRQNFKYTLSAPNNIALSQRANSPFKDVRVRRALAMLLDRDLLISTFEGTDKFEKEGITVPYRLNSHVAAGDDVFWLDPKGKDLGEGAKYFQYNPTDAAALLKAAGIQGVEFPLAFRSPPTGQDWQDDRKAQVLAEMFSATGQFKVRLETLANIVEWNEKLHTAKGDFDGMGLLPGGSANDPDQTFSARYMAGSQCSLFQGPIPKIEDLIQKQRREFDQKKRIDIINEIQREAANEMPCLLFPGVALGLTLAWPWLENFGQFASWRGYIDDPAEVLPNLWYNPEKRNV